MLFSALYYNIMVMKSTYVAHLIVSLILILSLTLSSGCELISGKNATLPSEQPQTTTEQAQTTTNNITTINPEWSIAPAESQAPILPSIADVVAKVKPSVVAINVEVTVNDRFFGTQTQEGAGSGWIIDENGIIVTNNHVVEGAGNITVTLDDGRTFPADLKAVATDLLTDLAILKIDAENLPAVTVGDSNKLRLGDWVVAIGNSLDLGVSPSEGIVRSLKASVPISAGETLYNLIGTTAAINPGNSGGPLVNMAGEVIGITSAKISAAGIEGMGYAISTQEAVPIIQQLINTGYVVRPWLGVTLYSVDQFVVYQYRLAVDNGAFIVEVAQGSPADKAGLKAGDVITKFEGLEITDVNELLTALYSSQIGQKVEITFWRGKTQNTTSVTITESPKPS